MLLQTRRRRRLVGTVRAQLNDCDPYAVLERVGVRAGLLECGGPELFEMIAPLPIEVWSVPWFPMAGNVAVPTIRRRVGGTYAPAPLLGLP